jgi:cell division protein FtsZ
MRIAEEGVKYLRERVDTMITIPNDRLLPVVEKRATLNDALRLADDILRQGVQGVSDIITIPGLINVDFADVKAIMSNAGTAIMGIGNARGDNRAIEAAEMATSSPLLENSIQGARGVLLNVTAGPDLTLEEVYEASSVIQKATDVEDALIIFGAVLNEDMGQDVRVTVLATGFGGAATAPARAAEAQAEAPIRTPVRTGGFPTAASPTPQELDIPPFLRKNR